MFHFLFTLVLILTLFWVFWKPLGGRELFRQLFRDELAELRRELADVEDRLVSMHEPTADEPESSVFLRQTLEEKARLLRRRIARLEGRDEETFSQVH